MKLYVKNMVCPRCITAVEGVVKQSGEEYKYVVLGEMELKQKPSNSSLTYIKTQLQALGFELLDDQKTQIIEKIKTALIAVVQTGQIAEHFSMSEHLAGLLNKEYSSISKLFSQVESITIEQYFILQKIEKVKEWLIYDELSLSEITFKLGYSSVGYLSNQFKKVTGLTPSAFKTHHQGLRKTIDHIHH
ncbi:MAG: helix-turn-helix transcriptional regulator [Bacteroidota bacterium]